MVLLKSYTLLYYMPVMVLFWNTNYMCYVVGVDRIT